MKKKLLAAELNNELFAMSDTLGVLSYNSPSGKEEYFVEAPGINFQTPHKDAQLDYEDLWDAPGDSSFAFAQISLNGEYFGNSTFQRKYIGKNFAVQVDGKSYKGQFKENSINLS